MVGTAPTTILHRLVDIPFLQFGSLAINHNTEEGFLIAAQGRLHMSEALLPYLDPVLYTRAMATGTTTSITRCLQEQPTILWSMLRTCTTSEPQAQEVRRVTAVTTKVIPGPTLQDLSVPHSPQPGNYHPFLSIILPTL
jgi:hypothetical protein